MADRRLGDVGYGDGGAGYFRRQRRVAAHRGQSLRHHGRSHLGPHQLPHLQRDHPAGHKLDRKIHRPQAFSHPLHHHFYHRVSPMRSGAEPTDTDPRPHFAGNGRRCASADRAVRIAREFPAGQTRCGDGAIRHGRRGGADHRPDPRRLDHGQLFVAVDLLHQFAGGSVGGVHGEHVRRGPAVPEGPKARADRLHWFRLDGTRTRGA